MAKTTLIKIRFRKLNPIKGIFNPFSLKLFT